MSVPFPVRFPAGFFGLSPPILSRAAKILSTELIAQTPLERVEKH